MKFKKNMLCAMLASAIALATGNAQAGDELTFKLGFVDPATSSYALGGQKFADELEKMTNGQVKVEIVGGGTLGGEREMFEGVQMGTLDMGTAVNSVLSQFIPEMVLLDQPYLFDSAEQARAAIDGKLGDLIREKAEAQGVHVIGWIESGFRDVFSKKPITKIEDFKGVKIRTMENAMQIAAFNAVGAISTPMAFTEQYTALQQGTIDANENAVCNMLVNKYYEIIKNVTSTHHQFTVIAVVVSDRAWNKIPDEYKPKMYEAMKIATKWQREHLDKLNADAKVELEKLGVQFHDIDRNAMKEIIVPKVADLRKDVPQEWLDAVNNAQAK